MFYDTPCSAWRFTECVLYGNSNLVCRHSANVDVVNAFKSIGVADCLRIDFCNIAKSGYLPTLRHAFDERGVLVTGEAHADEPFAVEFFGHPFENRDPPPIVLYQVVISRQDPRYLPLRFKGWALELDRYKLVDT